MRPQLFEMADEVRSKRDKKIAGTVIGYGTLQWPEPKEDHDQAPVLVYLVQVDKRGSSSLQPAIAVLSAEQTVGRWAEEE